MRLIAMLAVAVATLCVACPTSTTGTSGAVPEAAPSTAPAPGLTPPTCAAACANVLASVSQCPEGHFTDCETACNLIQVDPHQVKPNLAQLVAAKTVAQVRAAGWTCRIDGG